MRQAQAVAKGWNRKMRANIQNEEQVQEYQAFNANFGNVYSQLNAVHEEERSEQI